MKCEPDCQWTYIGSDGTPWHCECGAVDMALQMTVPDSADDAPTLVDPPPPPAPPTR